MSFSSPVAFATDKNKNKGINIDASVGLRGEKASDVDVSASIGGRKGMNADVGANLGGRKGLNANVDADIDVRDGMDADVDVSLGGNKGLDAKVDASIGSDKGIKAGVDVGLGIDEGKSNARPDVVDGDPKAVPTGGLTSNQLQAFNEMSPSERKALMPRCNSITAGGYDPALVNLCKLLRMSASR